MVLPVADVNPTRRRAYVTGALILANAVAFLFFYAPLEGCAARAFLFEWAAVPRELLALRQLGEQELARVVGPACAATVGSKSVLVSVVSAMFLHANLAHLGGNMLFLWVFGNNVEDRLGHARFLLFYVVGGVVATYVFAVMNAGSVLPLLGASGAVAAILGAYLIMHPRAIVHAYAPFPVYLVAWLLPRARITAFFLFFAIVALPAWFVLGLWFVLQLVAARAPVTDGVAYSAHVAGFVAGIVLLVFLDRRHRRHGGTTYRPARAR